MKIFLAMLLCLIFVSNTSADKKEKPRVIDIYIYETRQLNNTTTFYSWVSDTAGGDCEVEGTCPEIEIGWLQCGAMYIENKDGVEGKGISGQSMVLVTIAEPDKYWVEGGSGKPVRIWFGKLKNDDWDGKIYIEVPYKSTYKIRRTVNIKKE